MSIHQQIRQFAADLRAEQNSEWRRWAQFVFLDGGPAEGTDQQLRRRICEAWDREMEESEAELIEAIRGLLLAIDEPIGAAQTADAVNAARRVLSRRALSAIPITQGAQ